MQRMLQFRLDDDLYEALDDYSQPGELHDGMPKAQVVRDALSDFLYGVED